MFETSSGIQGVCEKRKREEEEKRNDRFAPRVYIEHPASDDCADFVCWI